MSRSAFFSTRIIALTGGAMGIGRSAALQLARAGASLALCDRNRVALETTAADIRRITPDISLITAVVDVSDSSQIVTWVSSIEQNYGAVDIVINNAGVGGKTADIRLLGIEEMRSIMEVNFWGSVSVSMEMLPLLRRGRDPILVNVSSIAGLMGIMGALPYAASKSAIRGFSESLRLELMDENIRVVQVHPGIVKSSIIDNVEGLSDEQRRQSREAFLAQKGLNPEQAAKIILDGIARGRDRIVVGGDAVAGDFVSRWFPKRYSRWVYPGMKRTVRELSGDREIGT